ncbi:hypothetical protein [Haloferax denitrificans]|uniref:hypothetical protein n=1 Tax=Haloferax denitrificans TaxID=35745 RepID=UPI003C6F00D2
MPLSNSPDESTADRAKSDSRGGVTRRRVLQASAGTGALLLASGTAAANGKGGQAIVREDEYYPDETFVILEVESCDNQTQYGSCRDDSLPFRCEGQGGRFPPGKGGALPFPWWNFKYESGPLEGELLRIYTRDNSIDTDSTYRWTRKEKDCPETPDYYQVGFARD